MKTDPQTTRQFLAEARNCAMQMMENGSYILKELPALNMPDGLREKLNALCTSLIGTKHDLIHEIFEIDELMSASPETPAIAGGIERIRQWISETAQALQGNIEEIRKEAQAGTADSLLQMLVMESAVNILNSTPSFPDCAEEPEPEDTEENDEDGEDEDEQSADDDSDPNCFAFYAEDSYPVGILIAAIRRLMARPDLPPETTENLKVFLFAMERLPLMTPGVRMSLGLRYDMGGESDWIEIRIEGDEFSLGRGTWIDGDADTENVFEVTPGYRDGDAFVAAQFAESFTECARDVCREIVIDDFSDEPFTEWDLAPDKKRWNDLPCSFL